MNSFSIDAKRSELDDIEKIDGVKCVYEASTYETQMTDAVRIGKVNNVWDNVDLGYSGEGTVVAVIDTGVNYNHRDMVLEEGVKTKYTKEEWKEKISLLGRGKYFTEKVPFGYDYATGVDECLNTRSFHGYHVAGIVGANGGVTGVAKNAQIIGIKVLGNDGVGTTDDIVKGIEDSVKLGADIINMSLGYKCSVKSDEDYLQEAINKANDEGVICCIAACNEGTSASTGDNKNMIGAIDTATVGSPSVAKSSFSVASVENIKTDIDENDEANEIEEIDASKNVTMSSFSSWGPTNELNIKPEISAPGSNINSLYDGSSYVEQSGTSMATPYIAGCEALVINSLKAKGLDLKADELTRYMKATMMNTADVIIEQTTGNPYSVRYQGAGLVNLEAAVKNNVIALCNNESKIELGEVTDSKTVSVTFKNYGTEDANYRFNDCDLYTNYTEKGTGTYGIVKTSGASISISNSDITVPAGGEVTVQMTINISSLDSESFIEGFVKWEGVNVESLGMPLLGFYGDWGKETIIDSSIYGEEESFLSNENNLTKTKTATGLVGVGTSGMDTYLGLDGIKVSGDTDALVLNSDGMKINGALNAFSPNNDGIRDSVAPIVTAIRSPKEVKVRVLDSEKNVVRNVATCTNLKKICYYSVHESVSASVMKSAINQEIIAWDGMVYNAETGQDEQASEGQYYIELISKITDDSKEQSVIMPVKVDITNPEIQNCSVDVEDETILKFDIKDDIALSPYYYVDIEKDGKVSTKAYTYSKDVMQYEDGRYGIQLGDIKDSIVTIMWEDIAGNEVYTTIENNVLVGDNNDGLSVNDDQTHENLEDDSQLNDNPQDDSLINDKTKPSVKILANDSIKKAVDCRMISKYMLLLNGEDRKLSFDVKVTDDNFMEDGFNVVAGIITKDGDNISTYVNQYSKSVINYEYKGDGVYNIQLELDDDEEELMLSVIDKAGNVELKGIQLYTSRASDNFERRNSINGLMHKLNLDNVLLTKDMLNEDGTFTVKGMLNAIPDELKLNDKDMEVNEDTMAFEENIKVNNGCTKVNFYISSGLSNNSFFTNLYYDDISIKLDNIDDTNDVIYASDDTYDISGVINSYISVGKIDINGENIYTSVNGIISEDEQMITKEFSHKIKLNKGENVVVIKVTNAVGHMCEKKIIIKK